MVIVLIELASAQGGENQRDRTLERADRLPVETAGDGMTVLVLRKAADVPALPPSSSVFLVISVVVFRPWDNGSDDVEPHSPFSFSLTVS